MTNNNDIKAQLISSEQAAKQNFTTDNILQGGCVECGCKVMLFYHYDSGKPVPDAPFTLIDSDNKTVKGKTDKKGLCLIENMPCGAFEVFFEEGSDVFTPEKTVKNNPAFQENHAYAALAGEYFSLYVQLRDSGYVVYDADDSSDKGVDVDDTSMLQRIPQEYRARYDRFWQLDKQINRGDKQLRAAVNQIHHALAAEIASVADDNASVMLICHILLGFVPVVGSALDVYDLGQWGWTTFDDESSREDPLHWANGGLIMVGFIPGLGDAFKKVGQAILKSLSKNTPAAIQTAIKVIRSLSDGNIVKFLKKLQAQLDEYAEKVSELINKVIQGLTKTLADGASWIMAVLGEHFVQFIEVLNQLAQKIAGIFTDLKTKVDEFINKIAQRFSGDSVSKNQKDAISSHNAGKSTGEGIEGTEAQQLSENKEKIEQNNSNALTEQATCTNGCPIDMATGNVVEWRTDIEIAGALGLTLQRFYHSGQEHSAGLLGTRWRSNWDMTLTLDKGIACLTDWKYSKAYYLIPKNDGDSAHAAHFPDWKLVRKAGALELHEKNGLRYRFAYALGKTLLLSHIQDNLGRTHEFIYDRGRLKQILLCDGRTIKVNLQQRRIASLSLHDRLGNQLSLLASYQYDKQGFLTCCRAGLGKSFDYQYSQEGYLLRWQDLSHTWVEHDYDEKGRAIRSRGAESRFCDSLSYDDENKVVHYHSPFHGSKKYYRDERNNIIRIEMPNGEVTFNEWKNNQLVKTSNAQGDTSTFSYDSQGNITKATAPDGSARRWQYNEQSQVTQFTDALGNQWRTEYNSQNLPITLIDPLDNKTCLEYNEQGQCIGVIDADGVKVQYGYDALGLVNFIAQSEQLPLQIERDQLGRVIKAVQGEQCQYWHYWRESRLVSQITDQHQQIIQAFEYDIEGNVIQSTNVKGEKHQYRYGAFDVLAKHQDPLGQLTHYFYNAECQFAGFTNSKKESWRYEFDSSGRIVTETHLDGRKTHFSYNSANQLTHITRADGSQIKQDFDKCGRLLQKEFYQADGTLTDCHQFSYDSEGQLLSGANQVSDVQFHYDSAGRVIKEQQNEHNIEYDYSAAGRLTNAQGLLLPCKQQWQQGKLSGIHLGNFDPLNFHYDNQGRETLRFQEKGFSLAQSFDEHGLLAQQQVGRFFNRTNALTPDAAKQQLTHSERQYQYDALGQLNQIKDSHFGTTHYQHNALGQIISETRSAPWQNKNQPKEKRHFSYDNQQLTNIDKITKHSDGLSEHSYQSQKQEKSLQYGQAGRVVKVGNTTLRYDINGRLAEKITEDNGFRPKTTQYRWNENDELISVKLDNGDCWCYEYDVFGRRVRKYRSLQHIEKEQTHYQWQGDQLSQQQKIYADGSIATTQWVYEPDTFRPLAQARYFERPQSDQQEDIELHFAVTDIGGNVRELCTPEGDIEWRGEAGLWQDFAKWRKTIKHKQYLEEAANEPLNCDLRFQGQVYDKETNLYYNRHRYYDPEICQYISPDPIGIAGGERPQAYVHNPVEWVDPFGLTAPEKEGFFVYALYDKGKEEPYYIGISNAPERRLQEHIKSGRFVTGKQKILQSGLLFKEARGYEQVYIEKFGTKTAVIGKPISSTNNGNKINSFDKNREDNRGIAFKKEYDTAYEKVNGIKTPKCG